MIIDGRSAIRLTKLKGIIWFFTVLFLVLSFPLQVYSNSPNVALLPYFFIVVIMILTFFYPFGETFTKINQFREVKSKGISLMINLYLFLLFFNTTWQVLFKTITPYEGVSALVIYFLPVLFYWYFRSFGSEQEIRWILWGMVLAGLIVGGYFAYDSYSKLVLGNVTDYALKAFQYSLDRANMPSAQANPARVLVSARAYGLLQTHSVSGAWIVIGMLASLALTQYDRRLLRQFIILIFGTLLLVSLNFTSIISFFLIVFLFEFGGSSIFSDKLSITLGKIIKFLFFSLILILLCNWAAGNVMSEVIYKMFLHQKKFLLGTNEVWEEGKLRSVFLTFRSYLGHIKKYPLTIIFGDGFSRFGFEKGGDVGFPGTMAKLGLTFFTISIFGFFNLFKSRLELLKTIGNSEQGRKLKFSVATILLVLIAEGHYSIWTAKAILPILFFSLALCERYAPHNSWLKAE